MGKCFQRGVKLSWHGPFLPHPFALLLPGTLRQDSQVGAGGEEREGRRGSFLWPPWRELHAAMAEEKRRSVSLMVLWSHTPGQNQYLRLLSTLENQSLICLKHYIRSRSFEAEHSSSWTKQDLFLFLFLFFPWLMEGL